MSISHDSSLSGLFLSRLSCRPLSLQVHPAGPVQQHHGRKFQPPCPSTGHDSSLRGLFLSRLSYKTPGRPLSLQVHPAGPLQQHHGRGFSSLVRHVPRFFSWWSVLFLSRFSYKTPAALSSPCRYTLLDLSNNAITAVDSSSLVQVPRFFSSWSVPKQAFLPPSLLAGTPCWTSPTTTSRPWGRPPSPT